MTPLGLIAEDDPRKSDALLELTNEICSGWQWRIERDFNGAMRAIEEMDFSIILMDITLPCFATGFLDADNPPMNLAGRDIIREVELIGRPCKVIVVTQFRSFAEATGGISFDDLRAELETACPNVFYGMIQFEYDSEQWRGSLKELLIRALK